MSWERYEVNADFVRGRRLQVFDHVIRHGAMDQRRRRVNFTIVLFISQLDTVYKLQLVLREFLPHYVHPARIRLRDSKLGVDRYLRRQRRHLRVLLQRAHAVNLAGWTVGQVLQLHGDLHFVFGHRLQIAQLELELRRRDQVIGGREHLRLPRGRIEIPVRREYLSLRGCQRCQEGIFLIVRCHGREILFFTDLPLYTFITQTMWRIASQS